MTILLKNYFNQWYKINSSHSESFETYNFKYDSINNIVEEKRLYSKKRERGPVESATNTIIYTYDTISRLTGLSDTDGKIASYTYDAVGNRLSQSNNRNFDLIRKGKGTFSSNTPETVTYEYNAANQLIADSLFTYEYDFNGNRTVKQRKGTDERFEYGYNFENRLSDVIASPANGRAKQSTITQYLYDGFGRRVFKADARQTGNQTAIINSILVAAKGGIPGSGDAPGNSDNAPGHSGSSPGSSENAPGQQNLPQGQQVFEHGNKPSTPPGLENKENKEKKEKKDNEHKEMRQKKEQKKEKLESFKPVKPTWYIYDQFSLEPIAEIRFPNPANGAGKQVHLRRANGKLYSQEIFSGSTPEDSEELKQLGRYQYFYSNHRNDITSMLKHNGQSLHSYLYDEFGNLYDNNQKASDNSNSTKKNDYTYSGKEFDAESGLSYFGARYYDPWSGTWITQDVYRGNILNPETLHRYAYVKNNPVNRVDFYGFKAERLQKAKEKQEIGKRDWVKYLLGIETVQAPGLDYQPPPPGSTDTLWTPDGPATDVAKFSDIADVMTLLTGRTLEEQEATLSDKIWAAAGLIIPGVSGTGVKKIGKGAVSKAKKAGKLFEKETIQITEETLEKHVIPRHVIATKFLKKSKFFQDVELLELIKKAEVVKPTLQKQTGNLERIIDAGKLIGIDKNTGKPTSMYTVITDVTGNLVTIFPGIP